MGKSELDWPKPTLDQAAHAAMGLGYHYGSPFSKIDVGESVELLDLTDSEAVEKLHDLASQIMGGGVKSHREIAIAIRSIGKIGFMGGVSTEIEQASFRVAHAITQRQGSFVREEVK